MTKKYIFPIALFITIIILWEFFVIILHIKEFILPRPSAIAMKIPDSITSILYHFSITMSEVILGFLIAVSIGIPIAIMFNYSKLAELSFYPYIIAIKVTPIIAVAPFLILWFGNGILSKIVAATIASIFPIVVNTTNGLKEIDKEYIDLMRSFSATKWQILVKLKFPNSVPYIFSGLKIASAFSIIGAVVAEFVGSNRGLGFIILTHFYYLETSSMFAALFALSIGGVAFFGLISFIESKWFSKYNYEKTP